MTEVTEVIDKSQLFAKVAIVMGQVRTMPKDGTNTFDKYSYVTADMAFERLGAAMAAVKLVALPSVLECEQSEVVSQGGKPQTRSVVHGQITIACGDTGATWTNDWWGEGIDRGDKSINKAITAMSKYHLLRLFNVGTGEDADADSPETEHKAPQRTQTQQSSNHTAQHRTTPQRPVQPAKDELDSITLDNAPPVDDSWDGIVAEVEANRAQDKKAKAKAQPFVWPVNDDTLEICAGLANSPDCPGRVAAMITYFDGLHAGSGDRAMSDKQYGFLTSLLDKRYNGGHNAVLSALIGYAVNSDHIPGWKVKELIDWLKDEATNAQKLATLDTLVDALKVDLQQLGVA